MESSGKEKKERPQAEVEYKAGSSMRLVTV